MSNEPSLESWKPHPSWNALSLSCIIALAQGLTFLFADGPAVREANVLKLFSVVLCRENVSKSLAQEWPRTVVPVGRKQASIRLLHMCFQKKLICQLCQAPPPIRGPVHERYQSWQLQWQQMRWYDCLPCSVYVNPGQNFTLLKCVVSPIGIKIS